MSSLDDKVVRVTMQGGIPVPDQDPVQVKKDNQKVKWCADFDFSITITGFGGGTNPGTGGSDCPFNVKAGPFSSIANYKYTITAGSAVNDPDLEVLP